MKGLPPAGSVKLGPGQAEEVGHPLGQVGGEAAARVDALVLPRRRLLLDDQLGAPVAVDEHAADDLVGLDPDRGRPRRGSTVELASSHSSQTNSAPARAGLLRDRVGARGRANSQAKGLPRPASVNRRRQAKKSGIPSGRSAVELPLGLPWSCPAGACFSMMTWARRSRLTNTQRTISLASTRIVAVRVCGSSVELASSHSSVDELGPAPIRAASLTV